MNCTINTTAATTSKRWINPPPTCAIKPINQNAMSKLINVQSKRFTPYSFVKPKMPLGRRGLTCVTEVSIHALSHP